MTFRGLSPLRAFRITDWDRLCAASCAAVDPPRYFDVADLVLSDEVGQAEAFGRFNAAIYALSVRSSGGSIADATTHDQGGASGAVTVVGAGGLGGGLGGVFGEAFDAKSWRNIVTPLTDDGSEHAWVQFVHAIDSVMILLGLETADVSLPSIKCTG